MSDSKDRLTFSEACQELQISEDDLMKMVADGEISSIKEGDTLYFKPDVIAQFKKSRKTEPTIILSDDEMDLLDGVEDISLDDLDLGGEEESKPAAASAGDATDATSEVGDDLGLEELDLSDLSIEDEAAPAAAGTDITESAGDDLDITLEDDISLGDETAGAEESADDTVLNLEGLLDDEGESELTTPVPEVGDLDLSDTGDDITLEGLVEDEETVLDTDVLDLSDDEDFELDETADLGPDATASTLLRGGGARAMQMKRVKGHPVITAVLLVTAALMFAPLAVLMNIYFFDRADQPAAGSATEWVREYDFFKDFVESAGDTINDLVK